MKIRLDELAERLACCDPSIMARVHGEGRVPLDAGPVLKLVRELDELTFDPPFNHTQVHAVAWRYCRFLATEYHARVIPLYWEDEEQQFRFLRGVEELIEFYSTRHRSERIDNGDYRNMMRHLYPVGKQILAGIFWYTRNDKQENYATTAAN